MFGKFSGAFGRPFGTYLVVIVAIVALCIGLAGCGGGGGGGKHTSSFVLPSEHPEFVLAVHTTATGDTRYQWFGNGGVYKDRLLTPEEFQPILWDEIDRLYNLPKVRSTTYYAIWLPIGASLQPAEWVGKSCPAGSELVISTDVGQINIDNTFTQDAWGHRVFPFLAHLSQGVNLQVEWSVTMGRYLGADQKNYGSILALVEERQTVPGFFPQSYQKSVYRSMAALALSTLDKSHQVLNK